MFSLDFLLFSSLQIYLLTAYWCSLDCTTFRLPSCLFKKLISYLLGTRHLSSWPGLRCFTLILYDIEQNFSKENRKHIQKKTSTKIFTHHIITWSNRNNVSLVDCLQIFLQSKLQTVSSLQVSVGLTKQSNVLI